MWKKNIHKTNPKSVSKIRTILIYSLFLNLSSIAAEAASLPLRLQSFVENMEAEQASIDGAVAILINGQVVYKKTFGHRKGGDNIDSDTLFALASASKPIIATSIGLFTDKKLLDFNKRVKLSYLKNEMSIANFLSHSTGYKFSGNQEVESGINKNGLIKAIANREPDCKPGECYKYSNAMYSFVDDALKPLGYGIESAISNLNKQLRTQDIKFLPINKNSNFAYPKSRSKKELPFPSNYQKVVPAAAGIFASLNAMIEFLKLSLGERPDIISQKTLDGIYKPQMKNDDIARWNIAFPFDKKKITSLYCLGWRAFDVYDNPDAKLIFHAGYINGATSFIGFIPSQKAGIIILTNHTAKFAFQNGLHFWGAVMQNT